jgi:hypothetical protein
MAPLPMMSGRVMPVMSMVLLGGCFYGGKLREGRTRAKRGRPENQGKHQNKSFHTSSHLNFSYFIIMFFIAIQG